jgi:hypothetical protein
MKESFLSTSTDEDSATNNGSFLFRMYDVSKLLRLGKDRC